VGGKPPPLDPATLTNSSLSRLPRRRAVLSAEKICDPRIERMIDARRFICPPIHFEIYALFASFDFVPLSVPLTLVACAVVA
jgi:hypothetical protein